MVERKCGGAIVNVSSISSFVGSIAMDKHAVYSSLKAAVDKLTQIMAHELGQYKVGSSETCTYTVSLFEQVIYSQLWKKTLCI